MSLIVPHIQDTVHYWGTLRILVKSIRVSAFRTFGNPRSGGHLCRGLITALSNSCSRARLVVGALQITFFS